MNADTEIKAPWDRKDHFGFQIVQNEHSFSLVNG